MIARVREGERELFEVLVERYKRGIANFIGAGVRVPTPEWGLMIASGAQNMITGQWWIAFFPGLAMSLAVLGFALVGDSLREVLDPARRR